MKKLFKFNVFVLIFTLLFSSVVYAEDTDAAIFYAICRAKDYTWYAEDGVFSVAVCQHGAKNDIDQWSFWLFSKNDTTKQVKTVTNSGENIQKVDLGLSTTGQKLIEDYGWTQEEATFLSTNFTYRGSSSIRYDIEDEPTLYGYQTDAYLDYADTNSMVLADFIDDLKSYFFDEESWTEDGFEPPDDYLPMLHYNYQMNTVLSFPNLTKVKDTFTWDYTEYDIYENNPTEYVVEMVASTNLRDADNGIGKVFDSTNSEMNDTCKVVVTENRQLVSNNKYSFMYDDIGKKVYSKLGSSLSWDGSTCGYYLYIRTKELNGDKVSYWKVYQMCMGGYAKQIDIKIDENGQSSNISDSDKDISDDSGRDPSFSTDSSDDASSDPSSDMYDSSGNVNASTLVSELKNIVSTLGEIPALFAVVCTWIPSNIITLISIGIGLIVVVGIVKWVL